MTNASVVTRRGKLGDHSYFALRIGDSVFLLPEHEYHRVLGEMIEGETECQALHPLMLQYFQNICDQFNQ